LEKPGKIPGKNWTGDKKLLLVDGRGRNIARPFIRAGVYFKIQLSTKHKCFTTAKTSKKISNNNLEIAKNMENLDKYLFGKFG